MELDSLKASLDRDRSPDGVSRAVQALWHQAKGNWHKAHEIAQEQDDAAGAWVHAHLHRVEGDSANAGYWYRRAQKPFPTASLVEEWDAIAAALLSDQSSGGG